MLDALVENVEHSTVLVCIMNLKSMSNVVERCFRSIVQRGLGKSKLAMMSVSIIHIESNGCVVTTIKQILLAVLEYQEILSTVSTLDAGEKCFNCMLVENVRASQSTSQTML